jgi:desulfoferrodoxin-like iron-binding protein
MSSRVGKIYFCAICGNEVEFVRDSGVSIVCCGEEMRLKKEGFNGEE